MQTEGHLAFAAWVERVGAAEVAARLKVNASTVWRLRTGASEPSVALAVAIEDQALISVRLWTRKGSEPRAASRRSRKAA